MENNNIMDCLMVSKDTLLELYKFCKVHMDDCKFECSYDAEKVDGFINNIVRPYLDLHKAIEMETYFDVYRDGEYEDPDWLVKRCSTIDEAMLTAKRYIIENLACYGELGYESKLRITEWSSSISVVGVIEEIDGGYSNVMSLTINKVEVLK
jgi:hypothetical protein